MRKPKNKKKRFRNKILFISLFFVTCIFMAIWSYQYNIYSSLNEIEKKANIELQKELNTTANLQKELEYQDTDAFIESIARKDLKMIKPNEMIIVNKAEN